jgi:heme-degrading monooxygenase HmoA
MILRLFGFRPVGSGSELDVALRTEVLPDILAIDGIVDAYVARSGDGANGERILATIWESRAAMTAEIGEESVIGRFHPERLEELSSSRLDILPVEVAVTFDRAEQPSILRVFRGEVQPGRLDEYAEEARTGTIADGETNEGLVALYLAAERPSRFLTVSAWTTWSAIETATGGNVRSPIATRNARLIATGAPTHYEIVPATSRPGRG